METFRHHQWEFVFGMQTLAQVPPEGPPEFAFAGRSNVGKSSLLNALTGRKALARTSNTPGRTQQLNFFTGQAPKTQSPELMLVDMTGYGYAKVSKTQRKAWQGMIKTYLQGRRTLKRTFILVDARRGMKESDSEMLTLCDEAALSSQIVLTKVDKVPQKKLETVIQDAKETILKHASCRPEPLVTSSVKGIGIDTLTTEIRDLLAIG